MTSARLSALMVASVLSTLSVPAHAALNDPEVHLPSRPETVVRQISNARKPVLRIKSGQTVRLDTVMQMFGTEDAVAFYGAAGIPASDVLPDSIAIGKIPRPPGGGHTLTGPIYIEGAEPGDLLEVKIHKVAARSPYGVNTPAAPGTPFPGGPPGRALKVVRLDLERQVALAAPGVEVPLAPFLGVMAVAPPPTMGGGTVPTAAPGVFGGNMDFARLVDGSTLYLPVFNAGALFYAGDPHAAQGDGEADGAAIEASATATLTFVVHKGAGRDFKWPAAEDAENFYILGMDADLDKAFDNAVAETVAWLGRSVGLSHIDGQIVASAGVDFRIAEAVDDVKAIYGRVPKTIFKKSVSIK